MPGENDIPDLLQEKMVMADKRPLIMNKAKRPEPNGGRMIQGLRLMLNVLKIVKAIAEITILVLLYQ